MMQELGEITLGLEGLERDDARTRRERIEDLGFEEEKARVND